MERETKLFVEKSADCYFTTFRKEMEAKRNYLTTILKDAGFHPILPQGGYFILADIREIIAQVEIGEDPSEAIDVRVVKWLCKTRKLQGIPSSIFFSNAHRFQGNNYIRFCFIKV